MRTNRSATSVGGLMVASVILALSAAALVYADSHSGVASSSPEAIAYAQAILLNDGYLTEGGYVKGMLDEPTRRAVRQFQHNHFERPTGHLDQDTLALLTGHGPGAEPKAIAEAGRESSTTAVTAPAPVRDAEPPQAERPQVEERHDQIARSMPVTDDPLSTQIALGALLAAGGAALLMRRFI